MSFVLKALIPRATGARVALATALALAATSAAVLTATNAAAMVGTSDTIWGPNAPTSAAVDTDATGVELGTRFTPVTTGQATSVRFYKTPENRGPHTGSLWTSTGTLLGRVTFWSETSTGWQTAAFASPVTLNAGTAYVVSYHTNVGRYTATEQFTGTSASPNLRIPTTNVGVYKYGANTAFPTTSWHASQYWVDLTFTPGRSVPTTTTTPSTTPSTTPKPASSTTSTTPTASATAATLTPVPTTSTPTNTATKAGSLTASATSTGSTSAGKTNCVTLPSRCGYPDATNTGVPAGTTLLRVPQDRTSGTGWTWDSRGWISTTDNAIVENLIIDGHVEVTGKNVIVRNNRILQSGEDWAVALRSTVNVNVTHNKIGVTGAPRLLVGIKDIYGDSTGTTVSYNDISNASTGIQMYAGLVERNYIHDLGMNSGDHINGFTSNLGTDPLTIRNNTILNKFNQTDAISLFQDFGVEGNRVITGNLLAGGGYTIYGGEGSKGQSFNIQITNNRFSTVYYPNGGSYGPSAYFDDAGPGNVASGNYWDNNLSPVNI